MRKTNNNLFFLFRNALCATHGWRIGARERGIFASEPSEPGKEKRGGELRRDINDLLANP